MIKMARRNKKETIQDNPLDRPENQEYYRQVDNGEETNNDIGEGTKKPKFSLAPQIIEVAVRLINDHHSHLAEAKVCYMWRNGKWTSKDQETWGQAEKTNPKVKMLTGYDFIVTINTGVWERLEGAEKEALIDHELTHCAKGIDDKDGNPVWYIMPHNVEDFTQCIRRYGMWSKKLQKVLEAFQDFNQVKMFVDVPENDEVQNAALLLTGDLTESSKSEKVPAIN
jgi:hypothetical protein